MHSNLPFRRLATAVVAAAALGAVALPGHAAEANAYEMGWMQRQPVVAAAHSTDESLQRDVVRAEAIEARANGTLGGAGEAGDSGAVIAARAAANDRFAQEVDALQALAALRDGIALPAYLVSTPAGPMVAVASADPYHPFVLLEVRDVTIVVPDKVD